MVVIDHRLQGKDHQNATMFPGRLSNWHSYYHHLDVTPKPKPELISLGLVVGQHILDTNVTLRDGDYKVQQVKEINTFQQNDTLQGVLVRFTARSRKDNHLIELETSMQPLMMGARYGKPPMSVTFTIGSDYDPKEIFFYNLVAIMGPNSNPGIPVQADQMDHTIVFEIGFFDPAGNIAAIEDFVIEAFVQFPYGIVQPKLQKPLRKIILEMPPIHDLQAEELTNSSTASGFLKSKA